MRRNSPPRTGYGGTGSSPPPTPPPPPPSPPPPPPPPPPPQPPPPSIRRGHGGGGGRGSGKESSNRSLLVINIPFNCRSDELRKSFEQFGTVWNVHIPKDHYTRKPRGFAFVDFLNPCDASEARLYMNGQIFGGREISVVEATGTSRRPEEMRHRTSRFRGPENYGGRRSSRYDLPHAHNFITLVLENDINQGPILLPQDERVTILFPLEGQQIILYHQEILEGSEIVIKSAGHFLQRNILDHQEILEGSEIVIKSAGHFLQQSILDHQEILEGSEIVIKSAGNDRGQLISSPGIASRSPPGSR